MEIPLGNPDTSGWTSIPKHRDFDNIDHPEVSGLMIKALRYYTDKKYIITYVKRWLKAPIQLKDGSHIQNLEKGTPQGGVISPLLANLFLHIVFDKSRSVGIEKEFSDCPFERYADDIIVHVKNEKYAKFVLKSIRERMAFRGFGINWNYIPKRQNWFIVIKTADENGQKPKLDNLIS